MGRRRLQGFGPVSAADAAVLILGSMPGVRSLAETQYYAHPQNAFWKILGRLVGFEPTTAYEQRLHALTDARIALWDVVRSCQREGSLDSAICATSIRTNDFRQFFTKHPGIRHIGCNGAVAHRLFCQQVPEEIRPSECVVVRLPSTSPAFTVSFDQKLRVWEDFLRASGANLTDQTK